MVSEQEYGAEVLRIMRARFFLAVFPATTLVVPPVEATSQQRPWVVLAVALVVVISAAVGVVWARRVYPRARAKRLAPDYAPAPPARSARRLALGGLVTVAGLTVSRGNPVVLPLLLAAPMVVIVALAQTVVVLEKRFQRVPS